jgi:hypothetical protein
MSGLGKQGASRLDQGWREVGAIRRHQRDESELELFAHGDCDNAGCWLLAAGCWSLWNKPMALLLGTVC